MVIQRRLLLVLLFFSALSVCLNPAYADVSLPEWNPGYWWSIQTTFDVEMHDPDSSNQIEMIIQDDAPVYECLGLESRQMTKGDMNVYDVYVLDFDGSVSGQGTAHVDLFDFPVPIEMREGHQMGETWVDADSLGTVYTSRIFTGELWANIFFIWQRVGDIHIHFTEEYEPPRDALSFPLAVGNQWQQDITLFYYGDFELNYDMGDGPETIQGDFDDAATFDLQFEVVGIETYKGWVTFRVEAADVAWTGQLTARYAEESFNYAYLSLTELEMQDQGIVLNELTLDLIEFGFESPPNPTPTPDYSQTGITLHLNRTMFEQGDMFRLSRTLVNTGSAITIDEYIILDVYGSFWFWPEWSESVSFQTRTLPLMGVYNDEVALTFVWPVTEGSADNLQFWGAMLDPAAQTIYGEYDVISWGYK
jgi:hypothetical protein